MASYQRCRTELGYLRGLKTVGRSGCRFAGGFPGCPAAGRATVGIVQGNVPPEEEVAGAALRRAAALAAGDEAALRLLMHPGLQWTSFRGEVLGYEDYIAGNARGDLRWRSQRLEGVKVVVAGDTAVLTAAVTDEVSRDGRGQAFHLRLAARHRGPRTLTGSDHKRQSQAH
jgi:Domain of unknown function (DUF4440)